MTKANYLTIAWHGDVVAGFWVAIAECIQALSQWKAILLPLTSAGLLSLRAVLNLFDCYPLPFTVSGLTFTFFESGYCNITYWTSFVRPYTERNCLLMRPTFCYWRRWCSSFIIYLLFLFDRCVIVHMVWISRVTRSIYSKTAGYSKQGKIYKFLLAPLYTYITEKKCISVDYNL